MAWGASAYNMAATAAVWIFAESIARPRRERSKELPSAASLTAET